MKFIQIKVMSLKGLFFHLQAVENPSCAEIRDVLMAAGLNVYVEVRSRRTSVAQ